MRFDDTNPAKESSHFEKVWKFLFTDICSHEIFSISGLVGEHFSFFGMRCILSAKFYEVVLKVILEDLELLEIKPDRWSHSSDYFDVILDYCERLLKEGKAYVDETDAETMRKEREERKESKYRNSCQSIKCNL